MKKNIDLVIDGIAPEKVMYDTDNHSLVVLYPAQKEFKRGDILASDDILLIFDKYVMFNQEKDIFHSLWNNMRIHNRNWTSKYFTYATDEQKAQVHEDLRKDGKRWNAEKLQVEDIKKEFKRGDIVIHDNTKRVSIFDSYKNKYSSFNAIFSIDRYGNIGYNRSWNTDTLRYATSSEIEQFDNDLKEIGKKWNREALEIEDLDINEIVYNLSSACSYLNKPVPDFKSLLLTISNEDFHKYKAQITLQLICEAWNKFDGFVVDWNNTAQRKYYPQVLVVDECRISAANWITYASVDSSCYCFKSRERAKQFGTQFKELFKTAMGM